MTSLWKFWIWEKNLLLSKSNTCLEDLAIRAAYFGTKSYRIKTDERNRVLKALSLSKEIVSQFFVGAKFQFNSIKSGSENTLLLDGPNESLGQRLSYISGIQEAPKPGIAAARDSLTGSFKGKDFIIGIALLFRFMFQACLAKTEKTFQSNLLLAREFFEHHCIDKMLESNLDLESCLFFSSFERDSNVVGKLLKEKGIKTYRIPSPNPIQLFYNTCISDVFCFTAPFQKFEVKKAKYWSVGEEKLWPPFNYESIPKRSIHKTDYEFDVGFISQGSWYRAKRGDVTDTLGAWSAEQKLIKELQKLCKNADFTLLIIPHPCEAAARIEDLEDFYNENFADCDFTLAKAGESTRALNNKFNLGISVFSSANIERFYAGYKTLYAPFGMELDYLKAPGISNSLILLPENVEKEVKVALRESENSFFETRGLLAYRYEYFDKSIVESKNNRFRSSFAVN